MTSLALLVAAAPAALAAGPPACPDHVQVVRSTGAVVEYLGHVPGIPELCRQRRTADGLGDFYLGIWRSDWPGAGLAYPAVRKALTGPPGTRESFVTRSVPGLQWTDSYTNMGVETLTVGRTAYPATKLAHEREGIEGNTYHSIITQWIGVDTGVILRTEEVQITGQSYGPGATWSATGVEPIP